MVSYDMESTCTKSRDTESSETARNLEVVILAAGQSERTAPFDKLQQEIGRLTLLESTVKNYIAAQVGSVTVIVGGSHCEARKEILAGIECRVLDCPSAHLGMGASLAFGISGISSQAVMIGLADMPYIGVDLIKRVASCWKAGKIALPKFKGEYGHPVVFDKNYYSSLRALKGDRGARSVIDANLAHLIEIEAPNVDCLRDIDHILTK